MSSYLPDLDHYRELGCPSYFFFFFWCMSMVINAYEKLLECVYVGMSRSPVFFPINLA